MEIYNKINEFKPQYVFNKFDLDNKKYLSLEETKLSFIFSFGLVIKKAEIKELLKNYNRNKKNDDLNEMLVNNKFDTIHFDEYVYVYNSIKKSNVKLYLLIADYFRSISNIVDLNQIYTKLDIFTFKKRVKEFFPNLPDSFIDEAFFIYDINKDGIITYDEFQNSTLFNTNEYYS